MSANCCPKGTRRDDRFEEKLGSEAPIVAILAPFLHKHVARATSRGSGEASRVGNDAGNDAGASLSGFGRLEFCWLELSCPATAQPRGRGVTKKSLAQQRLNTFYTSFTATNTTPRDRDGSARRPTTSATRRDSWLRVPSLPAAEHRR